MRRAVARRVERGAPGRTEATRIAAGDGWSVADVVCTAGPTDRPFEEQHQDASIAVVLAGSFQYRSSNGREMLTPGALLLGNDGQCFECGHEHATGDRCVAFRFGAELLEQIAADVGVKNGKRGFRASRLPPLRALSPLTTRTAAAIGLSLDVAWDETAVELAATTMRLNASGSSPRPVSPSASAIARVTEGVRRIESDPAAKWTLARLASDARQSPYHYLRTFQLLTGVTPHQFVLRARLRDAALRLVADDSRVVDVALAAGFNDLSNFNAAFRREYGRAPLAYRRARGAVR